MSGSNRFMVIACSGAAAAALAGTPSSFGKGNEATGAAAPRLLLEQSFEPRPVEKVEIGDFHFVRGRLAPVHTHEAPVFGYVSRGKIRYQVAGQKEQLLNTGDAFYEPVGPHILHFDAAGNQPAVFTDFNFERPGEPFIKFPKPLTEKIDRRPFPTVTLGGEMVDKVQVYAYDLSRDQQITLASDGPSTLWYVDAGDVRLTLDGQPSRVIEPGKTFSTLKGSAGTVALGKGQGGKLIAFRWLASH